MLTQARLKEVLQYEPETGKFFWRVQRGSCLVGRRAGYPQSEGYWYIHVDGKAYLGHRLAWLYTFGTFPKEDLDHINRNRDDNRIANLRLASRSQNLVNSNARQNRSGLKGTYWHEQAGKWGSQICYERKKVWLGLFPTAEEAHAAYCKAAKELHGEFFHAG